MPTSLNIAFAGIAVADEEFPHPPGLSIIRTLVGELQKEAWSVSDFENWRDCGWSLECKHQEMTLLITLAQTEEQRWMVQVSPLRVPGLLGRVFGGKPSATPHDVLSLARAIHALLLRQSAFSRLRWCWDGYPDESSSTTEPENSLPV